MANPPINKYVDPATGETVSKCIIPEFHQKNIEEGLGVHQKNMNQFLMMSEQYFNMLASVLNFKRSIDESNKSVKERLQFACKSVGISSQDPWNYNMVEKVFEMREPPAIKPIGNSLLGGYDILPGGGDGK